MTLDPAIHNVGERYSSHYLDRTFEKDIIEHARRWREQGSNSMPRTLQREGRHYLRAKEEALGEDHPERRWNGGAHLAGWHARLLETLGYTDRERVDLAVEGGKAFVPAIARVLRYGKPWLVICETVFCLPDGSLREGMPSETPLEMEPREEQLEDGARTLCSGVWSRAIGRVFTEENAPRWV